MKNNLLWTWSLGLMLALPLASGWAQNASSATQDATPSLQTVVDSTPSSDTGVPDDVALDQTSEAPVSDAPAQPISTEKPMPPNLKTTGPVSDIIKLADAGVEENVMLAFVDKSSSTFNLRSDEIIYLKDIGVPSLVVTAMIQHDDTLRQGLANAATAAAIPDLASANPPDSQAYSGAIPPQQAAPQPDYAADYSDYAGPPAAPVTDSSFYDSLSPYGSWVEVAGYGRCWQPTVVVLNSGWRPYLDCGNWLYTDCGWYWHSDYSWGWAPFHYGRWFRHDHLGWCWTPDTVWGPSWVSWRYNRDFCGWAPLPPGAHFRAGAGFAAHGSVDFGLGAASFAFIPFSHFRDQHLTHHALAHDQVSHIFNRTIASTRIHTDHNRVINDGIAPERVAAVTRTEVPKVALHEINTVGGRTIGVDRTERTVGTISVFRPYSAQAAGNRPAHDERGLDVQRDHVSLSSGNSPSPAPLIIHGRDSVSQTETRGSPGLPQNSLILIGRKDANTGRPLPPLQPNQNSQPLTAMASHQQPPNPAPDFSSRLASRAAAPQSGYVAPWHTAPSYEAPGRTAFADAPRYNSGPNFAPQQTHSAPVAESHTHSAPAAPAPSASYSSGSSSSHSSHSSSDRGR